MNTTLKRDDVVKFLIKELQGKENVKLFSKTLKDLNICDLSKDEDLEVVTDNGGAVLLTLCAWAELGLLSKMIDIKNKFKEVK